MTNQNIKKHGYKAICACAMATMLTFNIPVQAQESAVPVPKAEDKTYTLTKVEAPGENVITKYEWSNTENKYVPVYYRVELNKTEYGTPNGDKTLTFGWEKNADTGNLEFKQDPTTPVGQTITYKYSESDFSKTETHTLDKGTIQNPSGTSTNHTIIEGGAAINNQSGSTTSIDNVLFKDNTTTATITSTTSSTKYADVTGGALYNAGDITSITGAFVNNGIDVTSSRTNGTLNTYANGGAVANTGTIGDINADFIGNYAQSDSSAFGGAIYNYGTIGNIAGDFIGNYAFYGGAIFNENGKIGNVTGDFIGNYADYGGVIYNRGTISDITGNFIGNYSQDCGGGIFNYGTIEDITGAFIGNYSGDAAAIYNYNAKIGNIKGAFIGNYSQASGGAIYNSSYNDSSVINSINAVFIKNYVSSNYNVAGGAVYNYDLSEFSGQNVVSNIRNITADFIENSAKSENGTALGGGYI